MLRLNPENQAGQWAIALNANTAYTAYTAYTVKVTGEERKVCSEALNLYFFQIWDLFSFCVNALGRSSLNFVYNLVEPQEGTNGSVIPKEGRPSTGQNPKYHNINHPEETQSLFSDINAPEFCFYNLFKQPER